MKKIIKNLICFIPLVLAALLYFLLPFFPEITEYVFSRVIFRIVSVPIGFLVSILPFSLTEILVISAFPLFVFFIVLLIIKIKKSNDRKKTIGKAYRGTAWFLSCTMLLYMINHGANFYRQTAAELMELDDSQKSVEFLKEVCIDLAKKASETRAQLESDENGHMKLSFSIFEELGRAENGYSKLYEQYPFLWGAVSRGKSVMLSHYWSYTGIAGMYFPFFSEANINTDQPDYHIPSTTAHELAHTRGFAREDECNFFSFLSCINSDYKEYQYSGYMLAYTYCGNELHKIDIEAWYEAYSMLSEDVLADLKADSEYWKQFEGEISEISQSANNSFIQSQGVSEGTVSYSKMTNLVLAYYEKMMYN